MPLPAPHSLLLALCWLPVAALADEALADAEPSPARQAELETLLYQDCGSCHGMTLRGGLGPALPESRMNAYSRDGLAALILSGVPGTAMPGWAGLLSERDARWLADQLQNDNPLDE
ncbi:cytochrome c class I NirC [Halomonas aestuarii]|uniref:Cytochrome c class I NirC n=1 Tax=Halomonas aestuarii TaxID=1897729 RepID=A0A1J0VFD0_9GAMM|nr:cytochrome c [Halomonas aestuarii]APE30744.1 cytochrome c class I NirC [Halomonas aestuarii]